jgi:alkanesulfonate monooxygenase SsuD/methylene tetrahydromethanopterin reductase-like flavin-dependent oxidoreductase (luciferase family)
MEFGYFTLSENNTRTSNQLVSDITDQAVYADKIGMHSAWIGEHHFNSLGILSCPEIVLSNIASRTRNIRLAPAVQRREVSALEMRWRNSFPRGGTKS